MRVVILLSVCEILGMGACAAFMAQAPIIATALRLTSAETGWISSAFYGGYMVAAPVLITLTDKVEPRRIYLTSMALSTLAPLAFGMFATDLFSSASFHALMGVGLAGTYMPGLRLLTDGLDGADKSRATATYTGCYAAGTAISFIAVGQLSACFGWREAFLLVAIGPLASMAIVAMSVRPSTPNVGRGPSQILSVSDVISVLSNRSVIARSIAYAAHNFELFGFWSWSVAFLGFAYAQRPSDGFQIEETLVASLLTFMLLPASYLGTAAALKVGFKKWIVTAMAASAVLAPVVGFGAGMLASVAVIALCVLYGFTTAAESGALTASLIGATQPSTRGLSLAVYSMIGFAGACAGPVTFGLVLELFGSERSIGWGAAFLTLGLGAMLGSFVMLFLDPS